MDGNGRTTGLSVFCGVDSEERLTPFNGRQIEISFYYLPDQRIGIKLGNISQRQIFEDGKTPS